MEGGRLARLLLVDNSPEYVDPLRDQLIDNGWDVSVARTPEEARSMVLRERFHLCILDKRLIDDHNPEDRSGIDLIPELWRLDGLLHFVLLTGWPEWREAQEVMKGKFPNQQQRCEAYIPKEEGVERLLEDLLKVQDETLTLNWGLNIGSLLDLEEALEPLLRGAPPEVRDRLIEDAELLLRWIFYSSQKYPNLRFEILEAQGRSGARMLRANADGYNGWVVKIATRLAVEEEWENYRRDVRNVLLRFPDVAENMCQVGKWLGAVAYSNITELETDAKLRNLSEHLRVPELGEAQAAKAVRDVVAGMRPWCDRRRTPGLRDLTAYYVTHFNIAEDELESRFDSLNLDGFDPRVSTVLPEERAGGLVANPLLFIARSRFVVESDFHTTHGDLNAANVLMPGGIPWLIDFATTGIGPTAVDWVTLESSLKFDHPLEASAEQWLCIEETLVLQEDLASPPDPPSDLSSDLERLFAAVTTLRQEVSRHARPGSGMLEYLVGLLYATIVQIRYFWKKKTGLKASRVLTSAGLIAERLAGMGASRGDVAVSYRWLASGPSSAPSTLPTAAQVLGRLSELAGDVPGTASRSGPAVVATLVRELCAEAPPEAVVETLRNARETLRHTIWRRLVGALDQASTDPRPFLQMEWLSEAIQLLEAAALSETAESASSA